MRAQAVLPFAGGGSRVDLETADLEHSFHGEQNGNFIIDKQNAALHAVLPL